MWQFTEAVRGLADGCLALGTPVTGGNVSFYNQTGSMPIQPTPVIGVLGVHDDVRNRLPSAVSQAEVTLVLLGETRCELGGSLWAHVAHGHLGGRPPAVDLAAEQALAGLLADAAASGLLLAAHDLSDGGLAVAIAEYCVAGAIGCSVRLPGDAFTMLFSESAARALVAVRPGREDAFLASCVAAGVLATVLGRSGGTALQVAGLFDIEAAELSEARRRTLPALFG
jgi:phosphoribosylformylglycinamidine synthase